MSLFTIPGTGFDARRERMQNYADTAAETDRDRWEFLERMRGEGRLGAEEQANRGALLQRRQASALASMGPGVRAGAAGRMAERAGDYAQMQAQEQVGLARQQDMLASQQALGGLMELQSQTQQQRAALDALYAQMGLKSKTADWTADMQSTDALLGAFGSFLGSGVSLLGSLI